MFKLIKRLKADESFINSLYFVGISLTLLFISSLFVFIIHMMHI